MLKKYSILTKFIIISLILLPIWGKNVLAQDKNQELFSQGVQYLNAGNYKKAESSFKKVAKDVFGHYPSYFNLSLTYILKNDYKKAQTTLEQAKKFNPYDIRIDRMYSSIHLMQENYEESLKYVSSIIFKKPQEINSHKKLGIIYLKQNKSDLAIGEFSTVKNLNPSDKTGIILLSISYTLANDSTQALDKLKEIKDTLTDELTLSLYALLLRENEQISEAEKINVTQKDKSQLLKSLISQLKEKVIADELKNDILPLDDFQLPEVSKRISEKLQNEEKRAAAKITPKSSKTKRPFGLKGKFVETFEIYKRKPFTANPMNGIHSTSNLKLEGKTKDNLKFSGQAEWFWNHWDHTAVDYYKININKRSNYELDIGKFSSKHFPTLVSYPTMKDGVRIWKKFEKPSFTSSPAQIPEEYSNKINLGELYRSSQTDPRIFKSTEITYVIGRTLDTINLNSRKEDNKDTYETTGQFQQWSQAVRISTQVASWVDFGSSFAITQDRPDSATVSSSTYPIKSQAVGLDGRFQILDDKLALDWETALGDYDETLRDNSDKNKTDKAWLLKFKYVPTKPITLSYEQKAVDRGFKVEGAYQTEDKISHTIDFQYKPENPETWDLKSFSLKLKPEKTNFKGGATSTKHYRTLQPVVSFKLPQDAKLSFDYKYYREFDNCLCSNYRTRTLKTDVDWEIGKTKTTIKPAYTFERKDDRVNAATDETMNKYYISVENKSIENLTLKCSIEEEQKRYIGSTTKSYKKHKYSFETKYSFIPNRSTLEFKISRDRKHPTDTNKTNSITSSLNYTFTSKSGDDKIEIKLEKKSNIYEPWSESSAYRQKYYKIKYTKKF